MRLFVATTATIGLFFACNWQSHLSAADLQGFDRPLHSFFAKYCNDCHADGAEEGGFSTERLSDDLADAETFARWERVFDRVNLGEMPPEDFDQPSKQHRTDFSKLLAKSLRKFHAETKSTVLRRLNRREYENTMNDVFGTHLDLESMLPEEARAHEFDNNGEALGLSMVHLQQYMAAAKKVLDNAISTSVEAPQPDFIESWYKDTREAEKHLGKVWKLLEDGAVARFASGGYPSGMLRGSSVRKPGRYRVTLNVYAYQSDKPISFSVGGTSFQRGSEKPIYAFFEALPDHPTTVEFEAWIDDRYMLEIEPYGIADTERYKRKTIDEYKGPGLAVGKVTLEGPLVGEYPSRGHQLIFANLNRTEIPPGNPRDRQKSWYVPKFKIESENAVADARRSILRVASATFRRPVNPIEIEPFLNLFQRLHENGDGFEPALRSAVTALLCSPSFLYFNEPMGALDDYAIASRLSYLLTRTLPDSQLMEAAAEGRLMEKDGIQDQTRRLIQQQTFERFLIDFTDSWLDLREMDFTAPDRKLFPEFDPFLRDAMPRETRAFLREIIESNLPIRNLVASDFAMLNNRLALHYGIEGVEGVDIRKVSLPKESLRGGILSQASVLKVTANGTNTSPVTRGAWVMERIQGVTPTPPPPGIPGVEPDIRGATTLREQLDKHRDSATCASCHAKIDPPGFALECFNPIGGYRERYRSLGQGERIEKMVLSRRVSYKLGPEVDSSGQFENGTAFNDFREFRSHLADQESMIARTFVNKLLAFATGREMGFSDQDEIERIVLSTANDGYLAADLIMAAVTSEIFRNK